MPVIRINEENYNLLQAKAKVGKRPISWALEIILTEYFKQKKQKHPDFSTLKDIYMDVWGKNNNVPYQWRLHDATALNRLIQSMTNINEKKAPLPDLFNVIMENLPEFYKDKSINAINKNLNGIIADIKNRRNKGSKVQNGGIYDFRS